jgi:S1-C subfamily serine protease
MKTIKVLFGIMIFALFMTGCQSQSINVDSYKQAYYENYITYLNRLEHLENQAFLNAVKIKIEVSETKTIFGSGVIYQNEGNKIYVLTNYHLVYEESNHQDILIIDYLEVQHQATFVYGRADYDLAILVFEQSSEHDLNINILNQPLNPPYGTYISGYPKGETYQMIYGTFTNFEIIELKGDIGEIIKVNFDVMSILLKSESGSSGSAVYDLYGHLIGLVFAGNTIPNDLSETYIIPSYEIIRFLDLYQEEKTTS